MTLQSRVIQHVNSARSGLLLALFLIIATACLIANPRRPTITLPHYTPPIANSTFTVTREGRLSLTSSLSQTSFVQGGNGEVYLTLSVEPPAGETNGSIRGAVDMVVVLDRSGSMNDPQKLPLAKQAIRDLVSRLNKNDRFGLITFDHTANIVASLTEVTDSAKERLLSQVDALATGGSTNISEGLELARSLLRDSTSARQRRVLLLSDGEANAGITDYQSLSHMGQGFSPLESSLSTIGLGLGFNESLLSAMADHGMGSYAYLENLNKLSDILNANLQETRSIYAAKSYIEITPSEGVRLSDASGYPIENVAGSSSIRVPTGALLAGSTKKITLTMQLPTSQLKEQSLGTVRFLYAQGTENMAITVPPTTLAYAILPVERREEAIASVDKKILKESWVGNKFGAMQRRIQQSLKEGDIGKAKSALNEYRRDIDAVSADIKAPIKDEKLDSSLRDLERQVDSSFSGSIAEQDVKRNRLAKKQHEESLMNQRK